MKNQINFVGINGYDFPYTRVRCYNFSSILNEMGLKTDVLSYRDHLAPQKTGLQMLGLLEPMRLWLNIKAITRLWSEKNSLLYVQKVHYHSAAPYILYKLKRNNYVLDYDDWDIDRSPLFQLPLFNKLIWGSTNHEKITRLYARNAKFCVASSRYLEKFLLEENDKVYYIPTGVDIDKFSRQGVNEENGPVVFCWTGQVWGKPIYDNIVFLLDCYKEVQKKINDIQFQIVAGGEWMDKLQALIQDKYNGINVVLKGWVHPDKIPEILEKVDVGLLPLIPDRDNDSWMRAKSPTKAFEYMAMEIPTVSSRFGEAEFIVKDSVNGFLASDKAEFIEKMLLLAMNKEMRKKIGLQARKEAVEMYSLDALGKKLCGIMKDAMNGCF